MEKMIDKSNPWTTLEEKVMYDNPWIRVEEHQVINPAGNPGIYGKIHFKNKAIAVMPLDTQGFTWLVGQYRYPLHSYEWELPEGGCKMNETPLDAAIRELKEETGLVAQHFREILALQLSNSVSDEISYSFVATGLSEQEAEPEEEEQLAVLKIKFEEAVDMVMKGEIKDALSVATILKVKCLLDQGELKTDQ